MALFNFLKPKNQLEEGGRTSAPVQQDEGEPVKTCPNCHKEIPLSRLWNNQLVCSCGYHFRMKSRQRIHMITDKNTFTELFSEIQSRDPIQFPGYAEKLDTVRAASGEEGGCYLRYRQDRKTEMLHFCNGTVFYDGKHGKLPLVKKLRFCLSMRWSTVFRLWALPFREERVCRKDLHR